MYVCDARVGLGLGWVGMFVFQTCGKEKYILKRMSPLTLLVLSNRSRHLLQGMLLHVRCLMKTDLSVCQRGCHVVIYYLVLFEL